MKKQRMIWSYDTSKWDRKEAKEMFIELRGRDPEDDEDIDYFISQENDLCLECERDNVECHERLHGVKHYVVLADLGLWNGRHDGGKVIEGLWNAIQKCFEDYNTVYQDGKRLKVTAHHHDGTNYFQIRELTQRGLDFWYKHQYDYSDRKLNETLFNDSHYSNEVKLFNEMYGW